MLYGTRRVVLLVHCIVPTVPISPQNPRLNGITILLKSTAPQNLMSPSSVFFVIKSFQDFTLYVNIETLNTESRSDQEQEMWMWNTLWEMLRITSWEKSCVLVNNSWWIPNLKGRDTKYSITQWKLSTKQSWTRNLIIFSTIWNVQQKWIWLLVSFWKKIKDGGFRYFYAHENITLLDRSKLKCTHDDLRKVKDFRSKTVVIVSCSRERLNTKWRFYKLTNLTVFPALLKDIPMGVQERSFTRTSAWKSHNQLSHVWREHEKTI